MNHISELEESLNKFFGWHKSRMHCLANIILSLFAVRTVNMKEIAVGFSSEAQIESRYKRLQRFFGGFKFDMTIVARWLFYLFFDGNKGIYIILDRTNWYWGKSKINVLVLSIAYEGLAIPIYWQLLDKAGNSTQEERIILVKRFIETFGKENIEGILADREFIGEKWFVWLDDQKLPFYIRIKEGAKVRIYNGKAFAVKKIFKDLTQKRSTYYCNYISVFGCKKLQVAAGRNERGELLIVLTNRSPKNAVAIYLRRWEIENLFKALKSSGFRFEATHMTKHERIEKLMAVISIAFCWAHKVGEWRALIKPIRFKKYKHEIRTEFTYFRYGFDLIRDTVLHIYKMIKQFRLCLKQIHIPLEFRISEVEL